MSPAARALFVLTFMGILTLQTATGFLHDVIGGLRPRAVTAIDGLIDTALVAPLGRTGAVIVLSGLSLLTAALAYRRGAAEARSLSSKAEVPTRVSARQAASGPKHSAVAPAPAADDEILSVIRTLARPAVTFRRDYPPSQFGRTLTFFGGQPIAPRGFSWPRTTAANGALPLTFMAQVDCSQLPSVAHRQHLPKSGVLYFFVDAGLPRARTGLQVVFYEPGASDDWAEIALPAGAPPCFGNEAADVFRWLARSEDAQSRYPRVFPRWRMEMGMIETFPEDGPYDSASPDGQRFYRLREQAAAEAFRTFHGEPLEQRRLKPDVETNSTRVWRPFDAFPHVWLAVEILAGHLLHALHDERATTTPIAHPVEASAPAERVADGPSHLQAFASEAHAWVSTARRQGLMNLVSAEDRAEFWRWLDDRSTRSVALPLQGWKTRGWTMHRLINEAIVEAVPASVDASLAHSSAMAALVPPEIIDVLRTRHQAVSRYADRLHIHHRHQMLGEPRRIQEAPYADDHILLLQLDWDPAMYWHFGDRGAYQYWISPADLQSSRYDKAILTFESH